jgi:probable H4MPT-linked C1 transfer pathway protein
MTSVIGWDIGGAHVKAAKAEGGVIVAATQLPCSPHEGLASVERAIREASRQLGRAERHGVTMTAELSDAFETKAQGVSIVANIFSREISSPDVVFYAGAKGFVARAQVEDAALAIASANWRASAAFLSARCADALFMDMGSTTTDLIPIRDGAIAALGSNDAERLLNGELAYTGLVRGRPQTGVSRAPLAGRWTPLVDEAFATMADVHRVLGELPEGADLMPTADGRDKTVEASIARLARLAGRDVNDCNTEQWRAFAAFFAKAQRRLIEDQIALLTSRSAVSPDAPFVGAGVGRGIVARLARMEQRAYHDLDEFLPAAPTAKRAATDCAPASAIALMMSP